MTTSNEKETIESLLKEGRVFYPSSDIVENSNIKKFMDKHGHT